MKVYICFLQGFRVIDANDILRLCVCVCVCLCVSVCVCVCVCVIFVYVFLSKYFPLHILLSPRLCYRPTLCLRLLMQGSKSECDISFLFCFHFRSPFVPPYFLSFFSNFHFYSSLWSRTAENPDVDTRPLVCPFTYSLAPLTCSLASLAHSAVLIRLLACSLTSKLMVND